jgi:hypothetical protein
MGIRTVQAFAMQHRKPGQEAGSAFRRHHRPTTDPRQRPARTGRRATMDCGWQ